MGLGGIGAFGTQIQKQIGGKSVIGSIIGGIGGFLGGIFGGKKKTTNSSANYQNLYQQSQQQIYNLQSQLAQKKEIPWTLILLIGGIGIVAIFLFKR